MPISNSEGFTQSEALTKENGKLNQD